MTPRSAIPGDQTRIHLQFPQVARPMELFLGVVILELNKPHHAMMNNLEGAFVVIILR